MNNPNPNNNKNGGFIKSTLGWVLLVIVIVFGINAFFSGNQSNVDKISYSTLMSDIKDGNIKSLKMQPSDSLFTVSGEYKDPKPVEGNNNLPFLPGNNSKVTNFQSLIIPTDSVIKGVQTAAEEKGIQVSVVPASTSGMWIQILSYILPMLLMVGFFWLMMGGMGSRGGGGAGNPMSFGKSRAKQQDAKTSKVRFADVAGSEEEKQELVEVVDFLKNPKKYHDLGARIPAGVLLEGPPGTGKTLLAKAVAGEAGVPFYSISGSDFVEMFVGVGASRVRDLFENAKKTAPSIIFIDEIDAVGRQRGAGLGGGNDEREQTLNQLLVEMDGFQDNDNSVIVIAATNRSDVLDPALLRPGRFDRKVLVGAPDVKGREAVLRVHAKNKPLDSSVDLKVVAQQTPGFVGADLENVLNEAALVAARRDKKVIDASDIDEAQDRVIAGPAKKDKKISEREREMVAYHEAGHTIVGLVLSNANTVHKVTIVPRGRAGGYMIALPKEDQFLLSKEDMQENLAGLMGGRAAEQIIFNAITTGASNDFEQATRIARGMVTQYGMSERLGTISYEGSQAVFIGRDYGQTKTYSEATAQAIDEEIRAITKEAYDKAVEIIEAHREQHKAIALALLKYETLDAKQIMSLYKTGKMPDDVIEHENEPVEAKSFEEVLEDANKAQEEAANENKEEKTVE
ncbi:ATP-dependent zinc metalloprotease FtsH [Lactococcus formosensis]|jgi:cell division protease FtsH|uniref:ATP-dependent zinc metalloprotease FtsH n=1 Tax=Lactococcus formosensis TaxID=1281486 RepID=A0A9Q8Y1Q4_9LACT|nr:ATP-dependent zinc metalloprotease FtsH [Lactococcus formosensis]NHI67120.1 ATP-dependent metallopeptidase FtsH/Yme1/Tma family protein [Lactococcus garvieae]MCH1722537.1 ATP-dependent zinc metalloprotease FtsH [Lactococcus formosensis]MCO7180017.1 ATP-dependent zinc metalloprotease FtsH [Lactococcus formosensis]MDG6111710.1 ATP-dependent zinc metalloprotease FtsH [Lactococcus formosensis]MDG6113262.1 ATP-dependent zinc metalloprotease FtsH [Lactococcus formosensis]